MRELKLDPKDPAPLWSQIETQLRQLIANRRLQPGASLPSVRALAGELLINPATVARAYGRLCDAGVLIVRRGEGTFVAEDAPEMPRAERGRLLREAAERFAVTARNLGSSMPEAHAAIDAALGRMSRNAGGSKR